MKQPWFALEIVPSKAAAATLFVASQGPGFMAYAPIDPSPKIGDTYLEVRAKLRFPPYIFATWPDGAAWAYLLSDEGKRAGIANIIRTDEGKPRRMPQSAIDAMRSFYVRDPRLAARERYQPGQAVTVYIVPGHPQTAIFVGYGQGGRAIVRIWIFGAERETLLAADAVEDLAGTLTASRKLA